MASHPHTLLTATALALAAIVASMVAAAPSHAANSAPASASSGCGRVSLTPASKKVRRGGKVLLSGALCSASQASGDNSQKVKLKLRLKNKKRGWKTVNTAVADGSGRFSVCTKVRVPKRTKVARIKAIGPGGTKGGTKLKVTRKGPSGCDTGNGGDPGPGGSGSSGGSGGTQGTTGPTYTPPPPETGNPNCPLSRPNSTIGLTLPSSCTQVFSDTAATANPLPAWGKLDCASPTRHQQISGGADPHLTGSGAPQTDSSFRRLSAFDGDDVWGERCEAGLNDQGGPTALFHEGQRRVTFASIRLPANSPVGNPNWRTVFQMKQAQPYYNPNHASMFEVQVRGGEWMIISDWNDLWTAPAEQNTWTRFAFDITYSQHASVGSIKVYVDLNGDGDAGDANEQSPRFTRQTLAEEIAGGPSPVPVGASIPSHMRAGIYQNDNYSCPSGCSADIDNVQVFKG